ncbi:N-acetylmuramoyl-L-alanine amidase [Ulvibacterium sp.]|uniref:N-acetylmuramoyl-L-alanine amidase family protein n=1 Tax=Ulvibacterium sp. TaxID=2665914 RepID=UPI00260908CC|nr:N-acetylmuramoyl-L-alanine amidase [Ulvibacterium sp.]
MRTTINLILLLSLIGNLEISAQQILKVERKVILIDPGHGGIDSGTVSKDGPHEKDVVLDIARKMVAWNKGLLESKYDIYLTRSTDTLISLNDRVKLAKHLKPDIFVSLHCNHIANPNIDGIEIYVYSANKLSLLFANSILTELNQKLGFKIREVKRANFQILQETIESCHAFLVELGYLSNPNESNYLSSKEKRKALALALLMSL